MNKVVLCVAVLFFSTQAVVADVSERIDHILDSSGFNKLLTRVPDFAQAVLRQSSGALDPEVNSELGAAFAAAFDSERVRSDVVGVVASHYEQDQAEAYLQLVQTPLAQQMTVLERVTSDEGQQEAFRGFVAALATHPAAAHRSALVEQLDNANRASAFSIDMQTAFFRAVFTAIEPVLGEDMALEPGELDRMVEEVRQSLSEVTVERTRNAYLFAFRDVDDGRLQAYVELCQAAEYRWMVGLLGNALVASINEAGERAALHMVHASP